MQSQRGFTVLELVTAIVIILAAGVIFLVQKNDLNAKHRDEQRKIAINAIYHNLEEVVFPSLKGYPAKLDTKLLKAIDPALLEDTSGIIINDTGSQYTYEPSSCSEDVCQHYTLHAKLEKEAEYVKASKN